MIRPTPLAAAPRIEPLSRRPATTRGRRGTTRHPKPRVEIVVQSRHWRRHPRAHAVIRTALAAAATAVSTPRVELAIVLCHDSAIRVLNRDWRGKNVPTNVLSFPAPVPGKDRGAYPYIGDIVIAYQTTVREAVAEGKRFEHHLAHLAVHGYLHLLGYDHETDRSARRMERLERAILTRIAVPDPYAVRPASRNH
jgi:probable rRNA maturation factor